MFEALYAIFLNIVGNLLTPFAKNFFGRWIKFDVPEHDVEPITPLPPAPEPALSEEEQEQIRAHNRERLGAIFSLVVLYGATFMVLYYAMAAPMQLKTLGVHQGLYLGETRLGWPLWLNGDAIFWVALFAAVALYYPLFRGAQFIAYHVARWLNQLSKVTPLQFSSLVGLAFFGLTLVVCGHWVFVLYPKYTYAQALSMPFVVAVAGIGFMASQNRSA